jgi:hypothetical protein
MFDPVMQTLQRLNDDQLSGWFANHVMPGNHIVMLAGNRQRAELLRQTAAARQASVSLLSERVSLPDCGQYPGMGLDRLCAYKMQKFLWRSFQKIHTKFKAEFLR